MNPATMTGLELMQAMLDGAIPAPSISSTIPMQGVSVESGKVVFQARADERHLNPLGAVHGGFAATVMDTVTGCAVHTLLGGRIACASGADRQKVEMQLAQVGLASYFGDRVFSGHEMPRTKPAPDVYLAAAAALKVDPARCLVVEDTVTGVTAGVAAGATVVGYSPSSVGHSSPEALRAAGAVQVIADMALLPALLA